MMVGKFTSSATKVEEACEFKLTIESNDLKRMLECDPDHVANISGTVTCHALASSPLTVSDGMSIIRSLIMSSSIVSLYVLV